MPTPREELETLRREQREVVATPASPREELETLRREQRAPVAAPITPTPISSPRAELETLRREQVGTGFPPGPDRSFGATTRRAGQGILEAGTDILSSVGQGARTLFDIAQSSPQFGKLPSPESLEQIDAIRRTAAGGGRFVRGQTESLNRMLDETLGVPPERFRGDRPLTAPEQRFADLPAPVQALSQAGRTAARFGTGVAGFIGGAPAFLEPGEIAPEGDVSKLVGEEVQGLRDIVGSVPVAIDFLTRQAFTDDPSANVDPNSPLSKLVEGITGRPFDQEEYRKVVNQAISEAPESPLFGAAIVSGLSKGVTKAVKARRPEPTPRAIEPVERGRVPLEVEEVKPAAVPERPPAVEVPLVEPVSKAPIIPETAAKPPVIEPPKPAAPPQLVPEPKPVAPTPVEPQKPVTVPEKATKALPERSLDTMSEAIAMSSPSGKMSKRARAAANERLRVQLFGEEGLAGPTVKQPSEVVRLRRQAKNLRDLATRGMKPRAHLKEAIKLETRADALESTKPAPPPKVETAKKIAKGAAGTAGAVAVTAGLAQIDSDEAKTLALAGFVGAFGRGKKGRKARKARVTKAKTEAAAVVEAESVFAKPDQRAALYPLVTESTVSKGKFKPATDAQIANFAQTTPEQYAKLTTPEKAVVRKQYSIERRKQRNAEKLDEFNQKEFDITPDPAMRKRFAEEPPEVPGLEDVRDINRFEAGVGVKDPFRIMEKGLGKKTADVVITEFETSKTSYTDALIKEEARHNTEVIQGIGIKPGSKVGRAVQSFGEGDLTLEQITKRFSKEDVKKIVDGAAWYRASYERYIKEHNTVAANLHPGDRSKLIPRREKYFRHFREFNDLSRLLDIVEDPGGTLNAPWRVAQFLHPLGKKLNIIRRRLGGKTVVDAPAGYANYIQEVMYGIHINPMVNKMRRFSNKLEAAYGKDGTIQPNHIPKFRESFQEWVDGMSGVPSGADALMSKVFGPAWDTAHLINRRAKQNIILGNAGAVLAQPFNIPQAIAKAGPANFARGAARSLAEIFIKSDIKGRRSTPMTKDPWIRERYIESNFDKYRVGMINKPRAHASWVMRTADEFSTKMIWNAFYEQAIREGKPNPITFARRNTRKQVAGRGIGELPNAQRSKLFQGAAPFTIEVGNAMWAFIDLAKGPGAAKRLATFTVVSYIMNRMVEDMRGSPVSFDPLQALFEGLEIAADERRGPAERVLAIPGRLAGEALGNIPLGQTAAALYPKHGGTIPGTDIKTPTRKQIFGTNDPTRFGSTVLTFDAIQDWPERLALPFGGVQVRKTLTGIKALAKKRVKFGQKELPIKRTQENTVRALLFGPFATKEARAFFKERDERITKPTMLDYLMREIEAGNEGVAEKAQKLWNKENPTRRINRPTTKEGLANFFKAKEREKAAKEKAQR